MQTPDHFSRRFFLAQAAAAVAIPSLSGCGDTSSGSQMFQVGSAEAAPPSTRTSPTDTKPKETMDIDNKSLVIYFSHSGNTRVVANFVHELVGGDLVELKTVDAYPQNYDQCVEQARKELDANFRPKLAENLSATFEKLGDYGLIYLGYPNWWGTTPMAVATMLETYDFTGKTIIPFCTHEGSALGQSTKSITKSSPKSLIESGLAIRGRSVKSAKPDVEKWLRQLGKIK